MDREDRDNFRTIANQSPKPYGSNGTAASSSGLDQHSCQNLAETICGCYRRDEAQNPEVFAAALAAVLMDYPADIATLAADPRTGVVGAFPMGLPNIGQIKAWLDDKLSHRDRLARLASLPTVERRSYLPPPPAGPGAWANVLVRSDHQLYPRMVEKAKSADEREYLHVAEGIKVSLAWLDDPQGHTKNRLKQVSLTDDDLRRMYPQRKTA